MELTEKQKEGLETAIFRYNHNLKYTVISGWAGTGKTTLVKHIIEAIRPNPVNVVYCAFTGQACKVLKQKGNKNVLTLHKLLYKFVPNGDGTYFRTLRKKLDYNFIVVDECSMISQQMVNELLSYEDTYIIFLGDSFQLPPPRGEENDLLTNPHVFLDEVMRQALDNEIIKFSKDVREGKELPKEYKGKNIQIISKENLTSGMMLWADQILVATNGTRVSINNTMRKLNGLAGPPQIGDKIICLKNNWDIHDESGQPLVNGTIGFIKEIYSSYYPMYKYFNIKDNKLPYYTISMETDDDTSLYVNADTNLFESANPYLTEKQRFQILRNKSCIKKGIIPPEYFTYAYAITTHKSQGSQYNKVLIIEEGFPFEKFEHQRWLYTAITRAVDKVVLIRKG